MAPQLRSSSRTTSRNTTRPSTPLDAPTVMSSASCPDTTRPRKQRKTGLNARVAVDPTQEAEPRQETKADSEVETPEARPEQRLETQADAQGQTLSEPTPSASELWVEPPLRAPAPSYRDYAGLEKSSILSTMQPLGTMPTARILRQAGLIPAKTVSRSLADKNGTKLTKSVTNGDDRPKTGSTSTEDPQQSDSSRADGSQELLDHGERAMRSSRSRTGNNSLEAEVAPVNGHSGSDISIPKLSMFTADKMIEIIGFAISRAEQHDDSKVAGGLRWIRDASGNDPFLLAVLEGALSTPDGSPERSVFQIVMRDAIKRVQAEDQAGGAAEMARTQSATSTSSLSSAKSLDAETFAPTMTSGSGNASVPAKGKAARAAVPRVKGKGRSGPVGAQSVCSFSDASILRKRKREEQPELSEEAIAARRVELGRTFTDAVVEESHVRTVIEPVVAEGTSMTPSTVHTRGSKRSRQTFETGPDSRNDEVPPNPVGRAPKRVRKTAARADEIDNIDFCRACGGNGQLLCCDGCVDSFHFTCLEPPENPDSPPEGQWFCPTCVRKGPLGALVEGADDAAPKSFQLPHALREFFDGVQTGEDGMYKEVAVLPKGNGRVRTTRLGRAEDRGLLRLTDSKGKLIVCVRCGHTSNGRRPIIQCDYCPCSWHLDCLDPPMANPPHQKPGSDKTYHYWKCPNHIDHDLAKIEGLGGRFGKIRRPRNPKYVDIDVLPAESDDESFEEQEMEGTVYRVSERGLVLDFVKRVKRAHAEDRALAAYYAIQRRAGQPLVGSMAESTSASVSCGQNMEEVGHSPDANEGVAKAPGPSRMEDAHADAGATLPVRTPAEHQAAISLLAIAKPQLVAGGFSDRIRELVSQLIVNAPETAYSAAGEMELLQCLQDLVSSRLQTLMSSPVSGN